MRPVVCNCRVSGPLMRSVRALRPWTGSRHGADHTIVCPANDGVGHGLRLQPLPCWRCRRSLHTSIITGAGGGPHRLAGGGQRWHGGGRHEHLEGKCGWSCSLGPGVLASVQCWRPVTDQPGRPGPDRGNTKPTAQVQLPIARRPVRKFDVHRATGKDGRRRGCLGRRTCGCSATFRRTPTDLIAGEWPSTGPLALFRTGCSRPSYRRHTPFAVEPTQKLTFQRILARR